jgi:hypothetical protein
MIIANVICRWLFLMQKSITLSDANVHCMIRLTNFQEKNMATIRGFYSYPGNNFVALKRSDSDSEINTATAQEAQQKVPNPPTEAPQTQELNSPITHRRR